MNPVKREIPAADLTAHVRAVLDSAQYQNTITTVTRWGQRSAVILPPDVYDALIAAVPGPG